MKMVVVVVMMVMMMMISSKPDCRTAAVELYIYKLAACTLHPRPRA